MAITFTPLTRNDYAAVAALGQTIWHQHYSQIISHEQIDYMLKGRYTAENLERYLQADSKRLYLVRDGDTAIGYFSYAWQSDAEMKLEQLYLLADYRGRGIGRDMLAFVENAARQQVCTRLMLTVNKQNRDSIRVYEKNGFSVREEAVFDIGNGYVMDDYVMEKRLA